MLAFQNHVLPYPWAFRQEKKPLAFTSFGGQGEAPSLKGPIDSLTCNLKMVAISFFSHISLIAPISCLARAVGYLLLLYLLHPILGYVFLCKILYFFFEDWCALNYSLKNDSSTPMKFWFSSYGRWTSLFLTKHPPGSTYFCFWKRTSVSFSPVRGNQFLSMLLYSELYVM